MSSESKLDKKIFTFQKKQKKNKRSVGQRKPQHLSTRKNVEDCGGQSRDNWYDKKSHYKKKSRMQPHMGEAFETFSKFVELADDLKDKYGGTQVDIIVREIETLLALTVSIVNSSNILGILASTFQYLQTHLSGSLLLHAVDHLSQVFGCRIEPHMGEQPTSTDKWVDLMRDIKLNWKSAITNGFFRKFSSLLGMLVSVGLCKASSVTFKIDTFTIWEPRILDRHTSCFDIVDAVIETSSLFCESIYLCFKDRSFMPLFTGESIMKDLDDKYNTIEQWWSLERCGNLRAIANVEPHELDKLLRDTELAFQKILNSLKPHSFEYNMVNRKYQRLACIRGEFVLHQISSGIRPAPFAIEFYGKSSQGKTTCCDQIVDALLISAGLDTDKQRRATVNAGDKFMSNWTSDKLVMIVDDVGNTKADFVEQSPLRLLIDVANNQMAYAAKADLSDKGKVFISPEILAVTTNVKNLNAYQYSANPYSVQRRFICITVEVHPDFRNANGTLDSEKVKEYQMKEKPQFDDIWQLTIQEAVKPHEETSIATYRTIFWKGQLLERVNFQTALNYLIEHFHKHRDIQHHLVDTAKARQKHLNLCGIDGCKQIRGLCMDHKCLDSHFGLVPNIVGSVGFLGCSFVSDLRHIAHDFDSLSGKLLRYYGRSLMRKHSFYPLIPSDWLRNRYVRQMLMLIDNRHFKKLALRYVLITTFCIIAFLLSLYICIFNECSDVVIGVTLLLALTVYIRICSFNECVKQSFIESVYRRNSISPMIDEYRNTLIKGAIGVSVSYAAVYGIVKILKTFKKELKPILSQGSLAPSTIEEIQQRDSEENPWCDIVRRQLPICKKAQTSTCSDLTNNVLKNLTYVRITGPDGRSYFSNALFIKSNVCVLPKHYFDKVGESLLCEFRKKLPKQNGGKFFAEVDLKYSYHVPLTDLVICYVGSGGSYKDLTDYFPTDVMRAVPFKWLWRDEDGEIVDSVGRTHPERVKTTSFYYDGGTYDLTIPTKFGHCGAPLISNTRGNCIVGFHLGGVTGTTRGGYGILKRQQIFDAYEFLVKQEGIILTGTAEKFETEVLGTQVLDEQAALPVKSALNFMPEESQVEYFGRCGPTSTFKSDVSKLPISDVIERVCSVPNIYRGPVESPSWFGWQKCLAGMSHPALPFPQHTLAKAILDYKLPLIRIIRGALWNDCAPLTLEENMNGIPGKRFIDGIKMDTAIGFPLTGKKKSYLAKEEMTVDGLVKREFTKEIYDEIDRCENCYKNGQRAYPIAKACKKDEVLAKEKCRIFYGNAISLTFLIRKYYLPILRVLQMNPLASECAVGINCHGPEWEEMHQHVLKFGKDRIIGGDYGSYDQKIPSQLLIAALRILIDLASECKYTQEDINIMRAMVGDIVFSVIAFDGALIGLTRGAHISGNSLTVVLNGIVGSLGMRCFYYTVHNSPPPFRERVSVITYGDDNIGSTHPEEDKFTIKSLSQFLGKYGQIYTMPDKNSELTDYLDYEDFEFLKRKSVYSPEIGQHVGALIEKSIFKSLHMHLYPQGHPLSEEECSALNIDGALREWFNHGSEVYEMRRTQMREVAKECEISHMCTMLDCTYVDMVNRWIKTYKGAEQP